MTTERKEPTLEKCLASITQSSDDVTLRVFHDDGTLGAFRNYNRCLLEAIKSGCEYVGVSSDDLVYYPEWLELTIPKLSEPRCGYVALWTPQECGERHRFTAGWNKCNLGWAGTWGGVYIFPIEVAKQIVRNRLYQDHLHNRIKNKSQWINYEFNKRIDHLIPEVIFQMRLNQWFYAPSLVGHIGHTSTLGHIHTDACNPFMR